MGTATGYPSDKDNPTIEQTRQLAETALATLAAAYLRAGRNPQTDVLAGFHVVPCILCEGLPESEARADLIASAEHDGRLYGLALVNNSPAVINNSTGGTWAPGWGVLIDMARDAGIDEVNGDDW